MLLAYSYTLRILQPHSLCPRALFLSLITKYNLPYKYTKNSLPCSYVSVEENQNGFHHV
jgi:hypothetical protein